MVLGTSARARLQRSAKTAASCASADARSGCDSAAIIITRRNARTVGNSCADAVAEAKTDSGTLADGNRESYDCAERNAGSDADNRSHSDAGSDCYRESGDRSVCTPGTTAHAARWPPPRANRRTVRRRRRSHARRALVYRRIAAKRSVDGAELFGERRSG